jgi:hypothetical protein
MQLMWMLVIILTGYPLGIPWGDMTAVVSSVPVVYTADVANEGQQRVRLNSRRGKGWFFPGTQTEDEDELHTSQRPMMDIDEILGEKGKQREAKRVRSKGNARGAHLERALNKWEQSPRTRESKGWAAKTWEKMPNERPNQNGMWPGNESKWPSAKPNTNGAVARKLWHRHAKRSLSTTPWNRRGEEITVPLVGTRCRGRGWFFPASRMDVRNTFRSADQPRWGGHAGRPPDTATWTRNETTTPLVETRGRGNEWFFSTSRARVRNTFSSADRPRWRGRTGRPPDTATWEGGEVTAPLVEARSRDKRWFFPGPLMGKVEGTPATPSLMHTHGPGVEKGKVTTSMLLSASEGSNTAWTLKGQ